LTLNTLVQGAWAVLLGDLTGRSDVIFGATVSGRPPEISGIETMVGLFINTVPVRVRLAPGASLLEILAESQDRQSRLTAYHYLGLVDIQRTVGLEALFDTLVVFENYPVPAAIAPELTDDLRVVNVQGYDATHYPLTVVAQRQHDTLRVRLDYRPDLFSQNTVETIANRLMSVLDALAIDVELQFCNLEILEPAVRHRLLVEWNDTAHAVPSVTVPELFQNQAARTPTLLRWSVRTLSSRMRT
jgi:non-ribosomal peptide synthetase component F